MKKVLFMLLAVLLALPAMAQTELRQDDLIFKLYTPEGGTPYAEVSGNLLTTVYTDVTIPSTVSKDGVEYTVTAIAGNAFYSCKDRLYSVTIPSTVVSIGAYAFYECRILEYLILPNSLTSIGYRAFGECTKLNYLSIPNSVTEIGDYAFYGCEKLFTVNYNTTKPIKASKSVFSDVTYEKATLNVAVGGLWEAWTVEPWMYFIKTNEKEFSGIEEVIAELDPNAPVEVYNLSGVKVADTLDSLPSGLYIVRQGKIAKKVAVK